MDTQSEYHSLKHKKLLIVADNFGLNYSGGSRATAMLAEYLLPVFCNVKVLCKQIGKHNLSQIDVVRYDDIEKLPALIEENSDIDTIGFGDFFIAHPLVRSSIPFFFAYHDNWPEMGLYTDSEDRTEIYGNIFRSASHVFSVTEEKLDFIRNYTSKVDVVRNGLSQEVTKNRMKMPIAGELKILMAGNIDRRKYSKAVELFSNLDSNSNGIRIDILGHVNNIEIEQELKHFDFVSLIGFTDVVDYNGYDICLNTSLIENLSLSVVDSLANKTPVVSFDVGGVREVVSVDNGRIIPAFDVAQMAKTIIEIRDNEISFSMNSTNLETFDWKLSTDKVLSIMNDKIKSTK